MIYHNINIPYKLSYEASSVAAPFVADSGSPRSYFFYGRCQLIMSMAALGVIFTEDVNL